MTHPLTDEIIDSISQFNSDLGAEGVLNRDHDMRAAADWQLEECAKELENLLSIFGVTGVIKEEAVPIIVELFKNNMRPQEENS